MIKVNADLMKEVTQFQSDFGKGHKAFLQLRIKGNGMTKDRTMGVSKNMVQAYTQAEYDIRSDMKCIYVVIILATPVNPMTLTPLPIQTRSPMP